MRGASLVTTGVLRMQRFSSPWMLALSVMMYACCGASRAAFQKTDTLDLHGLWPAALQEVPYEIKLGEGNIALWAVSLNRGMLGDDHLRQTTASILSHAASSGIQLVILALQEAGKDWKPETLDQWAALHLRLEQFLSFSLELHVFARGLKVATKVPPNIVSQVVGTESSVLVIPSTKPVHGMGEEVKKAKAARVLHESYTVKFATKGSMAATLEITDENGQVAYLVVSNSHFGKVKNPLEQQMVARGKHLADLLTLVDAMSLNFNLPVIMVGDWNFRMSPLDSLTILLEKNGVNLPEKFQYSGPILHPVEVGGAGQIQMDLAAVTEKTVTTKKYPSGTFGEAGAFFDEVELAISLHKYLGLGGDLYGFVRLAEAGFSESVDKLRLTCRLIEGVHHGDVPMRNLTDEGWDSVTSRRSQDNMLHAYEERSWSQFANANYSFKAKDGRIRRVPSICDRLFWNRGQLQGGLLEEWPEFPLAPYHFKDVDSSSGLLDMTDHLPIHQGFHLQLQAGGSQAVRTVRRDFARGYSCLCPINKPYVQNGACVWRQCEAKSCMAWFDTGPPRGRVIGILSKDEFGVAESMDTQQFPEQKCAGLQGEVVKLPFTKDAYAIRLSP